jgi:hypothetical protein
MKKQEETDLAMVISIAKEFFAIFLFLVLLAVVLGGASICSGCSSAKAIPPNMPLAPPMEPPKDITKCLQPPNGIYGAELANCEAMVGSDGMCCIYSISIYPPEELREYQPYKCRFFLCKGGCEGPWALVGAKCMGILQDEDFGVQK